jgi:PAS domain S-box-containing protein
VNRDIELSRVLGSSWSEVLKHVDDAVLVLDRHRVLRFVNEPARRLLGYDEDQAVGTRCKLTTRGVDCENACPLTYALNDDIERVEGFATVYRTRDGRAVPLKVTVIPLRDQGGKFVGAVEILHPTEPDPGFVLRGSAPASHALRARLAKDSRTQRRFVLIGDLPACRDVARAIHRFAAMPDDLFEVWAGGWDHTQVWPPGTMYADGDGARALLDSTVPEGWRVVVGLCPETAAGLDPESAEIIEIPSAKDLGEDLPLAVAAWVDQISPGTTVSPEAARQLGRLARDIGFQALEPTLLAAVAAAGQRVEEEHIPGDGYGSRLVDEILRTGDPLAALEGRLLAEVLARSGWRMQEAADRLGMSRVTLWRKCKDHGITRPGC